MLINYNISGNIYLNDELQDASIFIRNLTSDYISKSFISTKGYYNINLANFPDVAFNDGDIIVIEFKSYVNGTTYYNRLFHVIDAEISTVEMDSILEENWEYSCDILTIPSESYTTVKFITNYYEKIMYKLYYKYKDEYKEVDSLIIDKQAINLYFKYSGEFRIVAYVIQNNKLLSYAYKDFLVDKSLFTSVDMNNVRFIEWE